MGNCKYTNNFINRYYFKIFYVFLQSKSNAMKGRFIYDYPRPMLTADCVVVNNRNDILLVRRGNDPFKGCCALPGGFMEMDETIEHCAVRELEEETGLTASEQEIRLIGIYSNPNRDPRGRTVTAAYAFLLPESTLHGGQGDARAGDDAAEVRWWPLNALPPLAFDHANIVSDFENKISF